MDVLEEVGYLVFTKLKVVQQHILMVRVHAFVVRHIFKTGVPHFQENYDVCLRL